MIEQNHQPRREYREDRQMHSAEILINKARSCSPDELSEIIQAAAGLGSSEGAKVLRFVAEGVRMSTVTIVDGVVG